jgi:uncharacterized protein YbcI
MEHGATGSGSKSAGQILAEITEALVHFHRRYYGKGPSQAKTYSINDTIVCMLHGGFTAVERTLIDSGESDAVYSMRHSFQRAMEAEFRGVVEKLTRRKVVAYLSQVHTNPDIAVELFVLEHNAGLEPAEHVEQVEAAEDLED